jgi:hypothetical protein
MENLTEAQKKQLVEHMNRNEDDNWAQHAMWATRQFNVAVEPQDCAKLFMSSMF